MNKTVMACCNSWLCCWSHLDEVNTLDLFLLGSYVHTFLANPSATLIAVQKNSARIKKIGEYLCMMQKKASYNALELIRHNPGKIGIKMCYFMVCAQMRLTPWRVYFELCGQLSPLHSPQDVAYDRGWLLSAVSWAASYFLLMIASFQHAQVFFLTLTLFRTVKKGLCSLLFSVSSVVL